MAYKNQMPFLSHKIFMSSMKIRLAQKELQIKPSIILTARKM